MAQGKLISWNRYRETDKRSNMVRFDWWVLTQYAYKKIVNE